MAGPTDPTATPVTTTTTPAAPNTGFGLSNSSLLGSSIAYILGSAVFLALAYKARQVVRK